MTLISMALLLVLAVMLDLCNLKAELATGKADLGSAQG